MKQKLLAIMCTLFTVQMVAWAEETSGYCGVPTVNGGKDVKWVLSADSVLTISGTGAMKDYSLNGGPWGRYIKKVYIEEGVTSIGKGAFRRCTSLTSITIPNSVTSIQDYAFSYCSSLTDIIIPNTVTSIKREVFGNCYSLTNLTIPSSVTSIEYLAFYSCLGFTSITIPNSVTSIGDDAFRYCSNLTSITIPSSVTSIGDGLFFRCSNLVSITVDKDNAIYDSRDNCNAIIETATNRLIIGCANTVIPNSVTSIRGGAFNLFPITSVTIPNSVASIEDWTFKNCSSLTSVTIGNSVTSIGGEAFYGCSSLSTVTCLNPIPPRLNGSSFHGISDGAILLVPDVEAYKASNWALYFSNIEQTDLTAIRGIGAGKKNISTTIHDLSGRRVTEPVKGRIYIVDGKTVVW